MRNKLIAVALSLLIAIAVSPDMAGNTQAQMGAPPRAGNILVATLPAAPQVLEPVLTDLARKVTATPDFSGNVIAGQTLNVRLDMPQGSSASRTTGTRRDPRVEIGREPRVPIGRDPRTPPIGRVPRRPPTGPTRPARNLIDDIPCRLLPSGCPNPIPLPGGTTLTNFQIHAEWSVYESVNGKRGAALVMSRDYLSPMSQGPTQSFVLNALHTAEYGRGTSLPKRYLILAMVSVTADKSIGGAPPVRVTSAPVPLEVPLPLSVIQMPTVFVLFRGTDFGDAAAIYFPVNSAFRGTSREVQKQLLSVVSNLLSTYRSTARTLSQFAGMASFITGLEVLDKALSLPHVDVKELKDAESNLNNDDFKYNGVLSVNDNEVEDESSSLFLFGVPGTGAQFYQHRDFGGMKFMVKTGPAMVVLIGNLAAMTSVEPAGTLVPGSSFTRDKTPNNSLSSFKWCRPECWRRPGS